MSELTEAKQWKDIPLLLDGESSYGDDKPKEECGVFGIFAPGEEVARITFFGLFALQPREVIPEPRVAALLQATRF